MSKNYCISARTMSNLTLSYSFLVVSTFNTLVLRGPVYESDNAHSTVNTPRVYTVLNLHAFKSVKSTFQREQVSQSEGTEGTVIRLRPCNTMRKFSLDFKT